MALLALFVDWSLDKKPADSGDMFWMLFSALGASFFALFRRYIKRTFFMMEVVGRIWSSLKRKQIIQGDMKSKVLEPWKEPSKTLHASLNLPPDSQPRVMWAYWHSGEDTMPGFCQLCILSWKVRNPDWHVIVVSDQNFKQYVARSDLPSTFHSLRVQYRSDLIRIALLRRYGGLYFDATTLVFRAFDDLWEKAYANNDMYTISSATLTDCMSPFPLNSLILVPRPENPVLVAWQKLAIQYLEGTPCTTSEDMFAHPLFSVVKTHFDDPSFARVFRPLLAYNAVIWLWFHTLFYNKSLSNYVKDHVFILPTYRWTLDFIMARVPIVPDKDVINDKYVFGKFSFSDRLSIIPGLVSLYGDDDPSVAERFVRLVCAVKSSSDFKWDMDQPLEFHISQKTTMGRICRAAIDISKFPIQQADFEGSYVVKPFSLK